MRNWNKDDRKIGNTDHSKFLEAFINSLVDSSFTGTTATNPKLMAIEVGVKALVITAKYAECKKKQELTDYWKDKLKSITDNLKKYLRNSSDHALQMTEDDFLFPV